VRSTFVYVCLGLYVFSNPKNRDFLRFLPCFVRFLELWSDGEEAPSPTPSYPLRTLFLKLYQRYSRTWLLTPSSYSALYGNVFTYLLTEMFRRIDLYFTAVAAYPLTLWRLLLPYGGTAVKHLVPDRVKTVWDIILTPCQIDRGVHLTRHMYHVDVDGRNYWLTNTDPNITL